jgi:hypothetical protein
MHQAHLVHLDLLFHLVVLVESHLLNLLVPVERHLSNHLVLEVKNLVVLYFPDFLYIP